jgi:hypothetical protein
MDVLIPLRGKHAQGRMAVIDAIDADRVSRFDWILGMNGYVQVKRRDNETKKDHVILLHRYILGVSDPLVDVDHQDDDPLNNTRRNLVACTHQQNIARARKRSLNTCTSRFKGVSWDKFRKKWRASIGHNYKALLVGRFDTEIEAARAYDQKAKELFGDFVRLNFPEEDHG